MPDEEKPLAPLPLSVLRRIQWLRSAMRRTLKRCSFHGTKQLDDRTALEALRSHLVAEIDLRLDYYESQPGYDWDWTNQILSDAVASALASFPSNWFKQTDAQGRLIGHETSAQFLKPLAATGWEHAAARRRAKGKTENQKSYSPAVSAQSSVGEQIRALRREARFSEEKLAELIHQDKRTVQRHIRGDLKPRLSTIALYEEAFSKALRKTVKIETPP